MEVTGHNPEVNADNRMLASPSSMILTSRKRKLNEDERLRRCRERNRVHARNTRERKKIQLDLLQYRIQELIAEKMSLTTSDTDTSVASILISLAGANPPDNDNSQQTFDASQISNQHARLYTDKTLEKLRGEMSSILADDEEFDVDFELLTRDRSSCTSRELDLIRRERNRMHAKRTRMRKKKMLQEMESIISNLETEVKELCYQKGVKPKESSAALLDQEMQSRDNDASDDSSTSDKSFAEELSRRSSKEEMDRKLGHTCGASNGHKIKHDHIRSHNDQKEFSFLTSDVLQTRDSKAFRDQYNLEHNCNFQHKEESSHESSSDQEDFTTQDPLSVSKIGSGSGSLTTSSLINGYKGSTTAETSNTSSSSQTGSGNNSGRESRDDDTSGNDSQNSRRSGSAFSASSSYCNELPAGSRKRCHNNTNINQNTCHIHLPQESNHQLCFDSFIDPLINRDKTSSPSTGSSGHVSGDESTTGSGSAFSSVKSKDD